MNKFFLAIAALLAVQAVEAQEYLPFQNPGADKCVVKGAFNKEGSFYALKLGSCTDKNAAQLRHFGKGKELCTSDKYCFDTIKASDKADTELVLRKLCTSKCSTATAGYKWTKVGKNQWQNGNKLCIEYNSKSKKFQQRKCTTLASDDKKSYQQWVFKAPPASIKCADWGKKWVCAKGWTLDTKPGLTCVGATGSTCANVCCRPATTCQSAGYANKCPVDYKFVNRECGNAGQKACSWQACCDYAPVTKTCKNQGFTRCPADYKFVDKQCGNKGQKPCSTEVCCEYNPTVIKCNSWNRCNSGFLLKPRAADIFCTKGKPVEGPGYAPTCSNDICCDPKPVEPVYTPISCGIWNEKYGQCNPGNELKSSPYNRKCYNPSSGAPAGSTFGMCNNDYCCQFASIAPPADTSVTCKQWTGKCKAADGLALVMKPEQKKCSGSDCASVCCERDTCENWAQRVVVEGTPFQAEKTGEDVCKTEAGWAGLMDKNDPRFEQKCADPATGSDAVCKASQCCVSA